MTDEDMRGLLYRIKKYLFTKKGNPRKDLNYMVLISATQFKHLVEEAGLYQDSLGVRND